MKLASTFTVPAPGGRVFDLFLDPATMRACIPGCQELERLDDTHYRGRLVNSIAHVRFNATFSAEIVELDRPREVRAVLRGEDRRLASSLKVDATLDVEDSGGASRVSYVMVLALWGKGKVGRMGESIFRRRSAEVEEQFVAAFSRACEGVPVDELVTVAPATATGGALSPDGGSTVPAADATARPAHAERVGASVPAPLAAALAIAGTMVGWLLGRRGIGPGR